ncbi:carbohydrate ABC transporter membrane protein 1, CUT1 family [Paenibacillus sp. 1_12]|uniref:carbohydrate ABC transporter permease n=1 Tax=Paenibacillus sp. 1_12 TaxID=1566278 RepID=UPI0008E95F9D|nr:sugar ABC transporter permease [Paenibacillus sp. 1_12]SFL23350.1 carbohydrate ABC transporter membrane protein 1, CUT1 family [Paenibacillus sp. 1_12]
MSVLKPAVTKTAAAKTFTAKPASYKSFYRQRVLVGYICILPAILGIFLFTIGPMLYSLYLSFTDWNILTDAKWIGLANYTNIFTQDLFFYNSLKATAYYSLGAVAASMVYAFIIALFLTQNIKGRSLFRAIFFIPSIIPVLASSILWTWLYDVDFGVINHILGWFGIEKQLWIGSPQTSVMSLIILAVWGSGNVIVIFLAGLQDVPQHLHEAVEMDGGNWWHKLRAVTVPLMTPIIFYNVILGLVNSFTTFTQAYTMTKGGPEDSTLFYAFFIHREAFEHQSMGYACALAWILFVIISLLTYLLFKSSSGWVHYEGGKS